MEAAAARRWTGWRHAMHHALYGPAGFFLREAPAAHFRTSVHTGTRFAGAVATLLTRVDATLAHPARLDFVDLGAGRGELCAAVLAAAPAGLAARLAVHAVERAPRPPGLDPRIGWTADPPHRGALHGLLFANEWLDNVPLDVAEPDPAGRLRYVEVRAADGAERPGAPLTPADAAWAARWWPDPPPGAPPDPRPGPRSGSRTGPQPGSGPDPVPPRVEIGAPRDAAWAQAVAALAEGLAVAVDYGHTRAGRPPYGTLTGYRAGRQVRPVPDGTCDLTAHVAMDSLADAAGGVLRTQREALHALGVRGERPPLALASRDPAGYVRALAAAGEAAELTARGGLGDFLWLATAVGPRAADLAQALTAR